jgi:outer membrane protein, heavy metal efflux system
VSFSSVRGRFAARAWVSLLLAGCWLLCGCEPAAPGPKHIAEVNALVADRSAQAFDAARLLRTDPRQQPAPPAGPLTLRQAVARTLEHNRALVAASESLAIARAQVAQASLIQNPTIGQSSGLLFPISPAAGLGSFDINITQTLNSIFTQPSRVKVARVQEMQAQIDLASQAFDLEQQAQSKYQELSHLVRSRQIAERVVEVYDRAVKAAEARQKVGLIPQPELNRARLQYLDALRQVRHLQSQYLRAAGEMNWLMGISSPPQWQLPEDELRPPTQLPPAPDTAALERLGTRYRLDLLRADFDRRLGEYGVQLARTGLFPQTTVGAEFARDSGKHWVGGPVLVGIALPIFDPGYVALRLAEDQSLKAVKTYVAIEGQVRQDVRAALTNFQIAEDDLTFFRERLIPQQEENVRLMQESFRLGNDDLDALLNTLRDYVTALQSYEDTMQAYQDSSVALQRAVGLVWERIVERAGPATRPATAPPGALPQITPPVESRPTGDR